MDHDLSDVERAYAMGDKTTLEELRIAAEKFKALERDPAYQEIVLQLRKTCHSLTEELVMAIGKEDEKALIGRAKFRDGIKFVLQCFVEKIEIWDDTVHYLDELEGEQPGTEATANVMMPDAGSL